MNVLVVGSGGREHALAWAIAASPLCDGLWCAPGNAGIAAVGECVDIDPLDREGIVGFSRNNAVDLVVVGPEAPLVAGLADALAAARIRVFGPSAAAAALEGSKSFMKGLCDRHGIPTAPWRAFTDAAEAKAHIRSLDRPPVVKADGLAAGKGVVVASSMEEAEAAADAALLEKRFGTAGATIIVEERLTGVEASAFWIVDGATALPLAAAQDHKRAFDDDRGPNTGGMGAVSPALALDAAMAARAREEIVLPTVRAMAAEGTPFRGVLFAGLMLTADGPRLLEYNVRFGDPEAQALLVRLKSDLLPILLAAADGVLSTVDMRWREETAVSVVMAAKGYPGEVVRGTVIGGLDRAAAMPGVEIFHAGTRRDADGTIRADGGRVLAVTALGRDVAEARARAYAAVDVIDWPEGFCRRDIGLPREA
jgi:phosphoribosylamine--glycine ligase